MKISEAIQILLTIHEEFGDLDITGGTLATDTPLRRISVTDTAGRELWPRGPMPVTGQREVDGVFLD